MLDGTPIHRLDPKTLFQRLVEYRVPYHHALTDIIGCFQTSCGWGLLLDLHAFFGPIEDDICIRDLRGTSCQQSTTALAATAFERHGFRTV